jgi:hypothetical protein
MANNLIKNVGKLNAGIFSGLFMLIFTSQALAAVKIEAFSITAIPFVFPVKNQQKITACYLDEYTNQQQKLNAAFKNYQNPEPPELTQENYQQLQKMSDSLLCSTRAKILGINKLPAIVFNDQYVIYGEQDLGKAIEEYQDYEQTETN